MFGKRLRLHQRRRFRTAPSAFKRVLLKLIGNAIKFTDRGNIEIFLDATTDAGTHGRFLFDTGSAFPFIAGDDLEPRQDR
jgi:signal transduction histidine kinase